MAWIVTFLKDPDKSNVGTAVAVYNSGQQDQFTYSDRILADLQGKAAFVLAAKAAQAADQVSTTTSSTIATAIQLLLNT